MINYTFSLALETDDAKIRELLARNPIPGNISLIYQKNPNFFQAAKVGNEETVVAVIKEDEKVIGFISIARKKVYLNGQVITIGYLSNLRIDNKYQGKGLLKGGFEFFRKIDSLRPVPFYFSTIITTNKKGLNILTKNREGALRFVDKGNYLTKAIVLSNKKTIGNQYKIERGSRKNLQSIITFLNKEGAKKNLYPHYRIDDFENEHFLKDFKIEDFYLALKEKKIVGMVGKWDQSRFKQNIIYGYSNSFKLFRLAHNVIANLFKLPKMPNIGQQIKIVYLSHIATENNDPEIFDYLLRSVYNDLIKSDYQYLMVGLHKKDPLLRPLERFACLTYKSRLFINYWQANDYNRCFSERIPYLELSTL